MRRVILALLCCLASGQTNFTPVNCVGDGCVIMKTPYEAFSRHMDFASAVSSDTISVVSVTALDALNKTDSTAAVIGPTNAAVSGSTVVFWVHGGAVGQNHKISIRIHDDTSGEQYEGFMRLQILNP